MNRNLLNGARQVFGLAAALFVLGTGTVRATLANYDSTITADAAFYGLTPVATLTNDATPGTAFDFGPFSAKVTMEFILEGTTGPSDTANQDQCLAMGIHDESSLRYEQSPNTGQLGFTRTGVSNFVFNPSVPSPTTATHIAYVWDGTVRTMKLYVNGALAGTITDVSPTFLFNMPDGLGSLGASTLGDQQMVGTIHRVTVYDALESADAIAHHASAFTSVADLPTISSFAASTNEIPWHGSASLQWAVSNATAVFLNNSVNNSNVTAVTNLTVTPTFTTAYTLIATNASGTTIARLKVLVDPVLAPYDAAIAADTTPAAKLVTAVTLYGTNAVAFDFGATSGDATMEFVLEGEPAAQPQVGVLAVGGSNPDVSLRYEQYSKTGQLGVSQTTWPDSLFTPAVPTPKLPTHIAFVWDSVNLIVKMYVNGTLAGTNANVTAISAFSLPSGVGTLGTAALGGLSGDIPQGMVGRVFRVTAYQGILPDAKILSHGLAFANEVGVPAISSFTANTNVIERLASAVLSWNTLYASALLLNGANVTGLTNLTVSPPATTTYTLIASNASGSASSSLNIIVTPRLSAYDAAIAADIGNGLVPVALKTNTLQLTGTNSNAELAFNFGLPGGNTHGDGTMEFILEGNPYAIDTINGAQFLAQGDFTGTSLRYAQYYQTFEVGFTRVNMTDWTCTPKVPSPASPTHIAFVWTDATSIMNVYVNGVLKSSTYAAPVPGNARYFSMPGGVGRLGATVNNTSQRMVGYIYRVTVYSGVEPETNIVSHAHAFTSQLPPLRFTSTTAAGGQMNMAWTGGGLLQYTSDLKGPWTTIGGSVSGDGLPPYLQAVVSPYSEPATNQNRFFRLER